MAVVDDRGHSEYGDGSMPGGSAPGEDFGRQPPHDMVAEQSVLGGMLLSKDAIADVLERIRPGDFYRPAHQSVYDAVLDLYGRGEPADPVTVSALLDRRGDLKRIGGAAYLVTLTQTVPTAANAGYYAEIVAEKAILRRLVEAGTRIVQYGYAGADGQDVAEVVDRAQAEVYEVTERRTAEDFVPLEELLQPTMDEIDSIASRGGISLGVPTGFTELDEVTNGLHPGQMIIVAARPGVGKALHVDTPLPTPAGWTTMGEVAVGDELFDRHGRPTTVVAATDVMEGRPCYRVCFSDGSHILADARHQWRVELRSTRREDRRVVVRTTTELRNLMGPHSARHVRPAVVTTAPLELPELDLPTPPYALGAWIGARSTGSRLASVEPEILARIEAEVDAALPSEPETPATPDTLHAQLTTQLGAVLRIPPRYLRASVAQRRALLAGLLDVEGTVAPDGSIQFYSTDAALLADVEDVIAGLGYHARRTGYTLTFVSDDPVFGLYRKTLLHKQRRARRSAEKAGLRYIVDIQSVASVPVRCVEVDNPEHLYLAGAAMVPTHNSTLGMDFMRSCSVKHGMASVIFSLEMSRTEIVMRLLSAEAKIKLGDMRSGRMSDDDWTRLARRMSEISEAPLFVDDSPNLTMMEIRAKARRLKQRHDLRLVVVDYLQLMTSGKKVESRQQEVSEFSRHLKLLAKELEVPVVAISQLNRGPEQRTDKRPMVSDLRESGSLEQDADMVILLHRPDAFERDDPRGGEADLILGKHRNGPTATITVAHQLHLSRFVDMARG
ncbi:MAG: replicative DNA helicase [Mycobacteriaceae bacterium]|nr:replicative DNA helicase [Mycobacteriaceae bacterium]